MFKDLNGGEAELMSRVQLDVTRAQMQAHPSHRKRVEFLMADAAPQEFRVGYQGQGNFTICVLERRLSQRSRGYYLGVAKRNPSDTFSPPNGNRLALRRAFETVGVQPPLRCKP